MSKFYIETSRYFGVTGKYPICLNRTSFKGNTFIKKYVKHFMMKQFNSTKEVCSALKNMKV